MKHATIVAALLAFAAGACGKKSGEEKQEPAAAQPAPADPAPAAPAAPALSDEQCKDVVLAIVACRSSGDDEANVAFDDWLLERFYGGTGIALLDPLQEEMDAWKQDPAKACADWRAWRSPEPFPDGAAIHAAAKAADCAKLRAAIDAGGGIPVRPDDAAE